MAAVLEPFSLNRMVSAVEKVRERLLRATRALEQAGIAYAVVGGNAIAAWVTRADETAVRNTRDVDILLRRADMIKVIPTLENAGFVYRHVGALDVFLDGPEAKARDAVHIVFANEKVRPEEALSNPDVTDLVEADQFRIFIARSSCSHQADGISRQGQNPFARPAGCRPD